MTCFKYFLVDKNKFFSRQKTMTVISLAKSILTPILASRFDINILEDFRKFY